MLCTCLGHILKMTSGRLNRNSIILQSSVVGVTDIVYVFLRISMFVSAFKHKIRLCAVPYLCVGMFMCRAWTKRVNCLQ